MGKTICQAKKNGEVKHRGAPTIEWYAGEKPQVYCYGYIDKMTDEPIDTCRRCADYVIYAQSDLERYKKEGGPCRTCKHGHCYNDGWCECYHPKIRGSKVQIKIGCAVELVKEYEQKLAEEEK